MIHTHNTPHTHESSHSFTFMNDTCLVVYNHSHDYSPEWYIHKHTHSTKHKPKYICIIIFWLKCTTVWKYNKHNVFFHILYRASREIMNHTLLVRYGSQTCLWLEIMKRIFYIVNKTGSFCFWCTLFVHEQRSKLINTQVRSRNHHPTPNTYLKNILSEIFLVPYINFIILKI